jgi:glutamate-1-semialdehyde aminotransferase
MYECFGTLFEKMRFDERTGGRSEVGGRVFCRRLGFSNMGRGAYFTSHHNWFLSTAHTDEDLQRTWDIFDDTLKAV